MQIRLSGLRGRQDQDGQPISDQIAPIPAAALRNFATRLRSVDVHVDSDDGAAAEPAAVRVAVRRRRGRTVLASARGPDPEAAVRRALGRARRLLRRDESRRRARRARHRAA